MAIEWELVFNVVAAASTVCINALFLILFSRRKKRTEERTSEKIDRLSNLLRSAGSEIEKLEVEVTSKSRKLDELKEVSKRLETLVSLKEEQVEAIRQELKSTLKESNRSNRLWTIVVGAMWFILGLIVRGFLGF
jgi:septal ring factor EnvC (AmiA/AmiB activator)